MNVEEIQKGTITSETLWPSSRNVRPPWNKYLTSWERSSWGSIQNLTNDDYKKLLHGDINFARDLVLRVKDPQICTFVSSTFTDTACERNLLIEDVYPFLRELGAAAGVTVHQFSEMRWGIRKIHGDMHLTPQICMSEIDRCTKISSGRSYILLLGDKYGYRPIPLQISEDDMEILIDNLETDCLALVQQWYVINTNVKPPMYQLKPRIGIDGNTWWDIECKMRDGLREASNAILDISERQKYQISVTHDEFRNGCQWLDADIRQKRVFVIRRKIKETTKALGHPLQTSFIDSLDKKTIDTEAQDLLDKLKYDVIPKYVDNDNIIDYELDTYPTSDNNETFHDYLRAILDKYCDVICKEIFFAAKENRTLPDEFTKELCHHLNTLALNLEDKSVEVLKSDDVINSLVNIAIQNDKKGKKRHAYVITGPNISGVRTIMALTSKKLMSEFENAVLIVRYINTSQFSKNIVELLNYINHQLTKAYLDDELEYEHETAYSAAQKTFTTLIGHATVYKPLFIILNEINEIDSKVKDQLYGWFTKPLPHHVHIIASIDSFSKDAIETLKSHGIPKGNFINLEPWSRDMGEQLLNLKLESENRDLTPDQKDCILSSFEACRSPRFLNLAFITSHRWRSDTPITDTQLPNSLEDMINYTIDELIKFHGEMIVVRALTYIAISKSGLTSAELQDLLSLDDDVLKDVFEWWEPPLRRLPPLLWVTLSKELVASDIVTLEYGDSVTMACDQIPHRIIVYNRFLKEDPEYVQRMHTNIAEYFQGKWIQGKPNPYDKENPEKPIFRYIDPMPLIRSSGQVNWRKIHELPHHLTKINKLDDLTLFLTDLKIVNIEVASNQAWEILQYWEMNDGRDMIEEYDAAITNKDPNTIDAEELASLARLYKIDGRMPDAERVYGDAYERACIQFGKDSENALKISNNFATLLRQLGKNKEAIPRYREYIEFIKSKGVDEASRRHFLVCQSNLATALEANGEYEEAESVFVECLTELSKDFGDEHPSTISARMNFSCFLAEVNKIDEAIEGGLSVVKTCEIALGADSMIALTAMDNLGTFYQQAGKMDEALEISKKTMLKRIEVLGDDHPDSATSMMNLSAIYVANEEFEKAAKLSKESLDIRSELLGLEHNDTIKAINNYACILQRQEKFIEAKELFEKFKDLADKNLGSMHPDTLNGLTNYSEVLRSLSEFDACIVQVKEIILRRKTEMGIDEELCNLIYMLANVYQDSEQNDLAIVQFEEVLEHRKLLIGADHPDTLRTANDLALVYDTEENSEKAEELWRFAFEHGFENASNLQSKIEANQALKYLKEYYEDNEMEEELAKLPPVDMSLIDEEEEEN